MGRGASRTLINSFNKIIFSKIPLAAGACEKVANKVSEVLRAAGNTVVTITITSPTRAPQFVYNGTVFATNGWHKAVFNVTDGMVYDGIATEGMLLADYRALWLNSIIFQNPIIVGLPPGIK
jgi:hypothetical protein